MYYEIYIDQFFAEHLLGGYLLLELTAALCKKRTSLGRLFLAGLVNAAAATCGLLLAVSGKLWFFWPMMGFAGLFLAGRITFGKKEITKEKSCLFFLMLVTVLFGSILEMLLRMTGLPLVASAALASVLVRLGGSWQEKHHLKMERTAKVTLCLDEKKTVLIGMIDTGNLLQEPLTGRPVSIVERDWISGLLEKDWEQKRGFCLIPYHSIGTEKGWLQAVTLDSMEVHTAGRELFVSHPVLAIYEGKFSAQGGYQMILHPQHTESIA